MPMEAQHYGATSAPLIAAGLVISGVAGGDQGIRGFVAAYHASTGQLAWRSWTVPRPGEPGSETWRGKAIGSGGGSTWLTGTYDPETRTLYWPTGNPYPDTDGSERTGDNLFTNCILALDVDSGKLRWFFQFTPHDLHDWDATEPPLLVDARFQNRDRKLLIQANRNGFFYVLDRTSGELLLAKPFVKKLTWATAIGPDGRPQLTAENETSFAETKTCPNVRGATNWSGGKKLWVFAHSSTEAKLVSRSSFLLSSASTLRASSARPAARMPSRRAFSTITWPVKLLAR